MITLIAFIITLIGSFNWFCIGVLQFDFIAGLFGSQANLFSRLVYAIVGFSAIWIVYALIKQRGALFINAKKNSDKKLLGNIFNKKNKKDKNDSKNDDNSDGKSHNNNDNQPQNNEHNQDNKNHQQNQHNQTNSVSHDNQETSQTIQNNNQTPSTLPNTHTPKHYEKTISVEPITSENTHGIDNNKVDSMANDDSADDFVPDSDMI